MPFKCVICIEPFVSYSDDQKIDAVCVPCGHVFHSKCIEMWFKTKTSCPQCRSQCNIGDIRRLYFEHLVSNNVESEEMECLQIQIESLKFEMKLCKLQSAKREEEAKLELKKARKLRQEVLSLEKQLKAVESEKLSVLESNRVLLLQVRLENEKNAKIEALQDQLQKYKSLNQILKGTPEEAEKIVTDSDLDPRTLKMLVASFKSALADARNKCSSKDSMIKKLSDECLNKQQIIDSLTSEVSTLTRVVDTYKNKMKEKEASRDLFDQELQELHPNCSSSLDTTPLPSCSSNMTSTPLLLKRRNLSSDYASDLAQNNVSPVKKIRSDPKLRNPLSRIPSDSSPSIRGKSSPTLKHNVKIVTMRRRK